MVVGRFNELLLLKNVLVFSRAKKIGRNNEVHGRISEVVVWRGSTL